MKKNLFIFLWIALFFSVFTTNAQNYALGFLNQNMYAQVPYSASLELTGPLTLEAWIYPTAWKTNVYQGCIVNKEGLNYQGYMLRCGANGTLNFNIGTGTTWKEINSSSGALTLNTWQHVAGVYDGTVLKIFVNGVQVGSTVAYTGAVATNTAIPLEVGRSNYYPDRNFLGRIDEVRIWNAALSATDIFAYYNATITSSHPNYTALVGYYEMDNFNTDTDLDGNLDFTATAGPSGEVFTAPYAPACNALFSSLAPAGLTSIEAYQSTTSPASLGGTNQHVLKITVDAFSDVTLSQLVFQTFGTISTSDILNARVWYTGSNNNFSPTTQFGATISTPPTASSNMTFTGSQTIPCGRSYLWLTYDINPNATLGNLVDGTFISAVIDGTTMYPTTSDPTGAREIAATCQHTLQISAQYGGGWYGGQVSVNVNGSPVLTGIGSTFTTGYGPISFTFDAGTGDVISVVRTTDGTYPSYMRVAVLDGNGSTILASVNPTTTGVTTNGYCGGIVHTLAASLITEYSAQLNGDYANCIPFESGFRYKKTTETDWIFIQDYNNPMAFDLQGLTPATNYHYQAYALVGTDTLWGSLVSFATTCVSFTLPFTEEFNSSSFPLCWSQTYSGGLTSNRWSVSTGTQAGGVANQMVCTYQNYTGISRLITPAIDFGQVTNPTLMFKYLYDDYGVGATLKIQTSTDLINWTDQPFSIVSASNTNIGPYSVNVLLTIPGGVNYIAWVVDGNHNQIDYWYIDNVAISLLTCIAPSNLQVSNINTTDVTLNWNRGDLETTWEVAYKTVAESNWTIETAYDTTYLLQNLLSSTTYNVKVRAACAPGDESFWTPISTFSTLCEPLSNLPIIENCESTPLNELPLCFSKLVSGNAYVKVENYSGNKVVCLNPGATTNDCYLVFPALTEPVNNIRVQFKYIGGDNHLFKIGYLTDPNDASSFQMIYNPSISGSGTWKTFDIITNNTLTGSEKIAIGLVMPSGSYVYLDSITISTQPQCVEPSALTVVNSNLNDITLSWITLAPTSNLEYKESTATTWTTVSGVTSPYTVGSLSQNTAYDFRVQSVCDGGILSNFTSNSTFSTLCDLITVLPYVQDFESTAVNDIPSCYNKIQSGYGTVKVIDLSTEVPQAGKALQMDFSSSSSGEAYIILPKFSDPVNTLRIGFRYYGGSANHRIGYLTDPTNAATFVELINQTLAGATGGVWYNFDLLTNNTLTGNERIAIKYNPGAAWYNNRYDSLTVMAMPSCLPPFGLTATNVTAFDATLNWNQATVGTAVDYNIEYKTNSETTWTLIPNVTFPYNLTTLLPMTTYQFRVQANCSATETSDFSTAVSFTTLCAPLTPPTVSETFATMLPNACWERKSGALPVTGNATLTASSGGWGIRTNIAPNTAYVNMYSTSCQYWLITPSIDLGVGSTQYQLDFDIARTAFNSTNIGNMNQSPNARFVVLISTDNGTTWNSTGIIKEYNNTTGTPISTLNNTLQSQSIALFDSVAMVPYSGIVKFAFFAYENDATYTYDNDIHIDNFQVNPYNSCVRPTGVSATNIGSYSAQINWTEAGSATSWVIEYGAPGFTLGTGTSVNASTNPYVISSLSPLTTYQYYVKADCGSGNNSNWSLPGTFTTLPSCPAPTALTSSNITTSSLDLAWTENGTATSWEIEYGITGFAHGTGTSLLTSTQPQNIATLSPATSYDFYVRAICGAGDSSAWSVKITITTPCISTTLPFVENFNGSSIPVCWSQTYSGALSSNRWSLSTNTNAGGAANQMVCTYQNAIGITRFISPAIDFTGVTNPVLTFKQYYNDYAAGATLKIQSSTDLTNWTDQPFTYSSGSGSVGPNTVTVNLTLPAGVNYIAWVVDGNIYQINYWYIDDVNISNAVVTCTTPTNLAVSNITSSGATATWTAGGSETQWELAYKPTASSTWNSVFVTNPTHNFTTLTASTPYDVKVRAICGVGDTSAYTAVVNFTTTAIATCNTPTGLAVTNNTNGSATINWVNGGTETAWELDYKLSSSSTWTTLQVTTHPQVLMGLNTCSDYNVRVRAVCSAGIYSNYTSVINFTTPPVTPTNVQVPAVSITDQSAVVTWTPGGTETQWQVEYKLISSTNWTTPAPCSSPTFLMTPLQSNSTYQVRVKALCGANSSAFTNSVQFTTNGTSVFTITASSNSFGTISPSGIVTVNAGANQQFTFTPNTNATIDSLIIDNGAPIAHTQLTYTFSNVMSNHTIVAIFKDHTGVEESVLNQMVDLYPNPTNSYIDLKFNEAHLQVKECRLYDMYGKLLKVVLVHNDVTRIEVSDLANGVYFVRMDSEKGTIIKKFVKK